MEEEIFIKNSFILIIIIFFASLAVLCFVRKLYLWLMLDKNNRIGFITSFIAFFSVHDIHNASSLESKKFRKENNWLNAFFWCSLLAIAIVMVFNTEDLGSMIKRRGAQ